MKLHELIDKIKNNDPSLKEMVLNINDVSNQGLNLLVDALSKNTMITNMCFVANKIGDRGIDVISEVLKTNAALTTLNLYSDIISDQSFANLINSLKINTSLANIIISKNNISDNSLALAEDLLNIKTNLNIKYIDDTSDNIQHTDFIKINSSDFVKHKSLSKSVKVIDFVGSKMSLDRIDALERNITNNNILKEVSFNACKIQDKDFKKIINILRISKSLSCIQFSMTQISDENLELLAQFLQYQSNITKFCLVGSQISDNGYKVIINSLLENYNLTNFTCMNKISDENFSLLIRNLENNEFLQILTIAGKEICNNRLEMLVKMLEKNTTLKRIYFTKNDSHTRENLFWIKNYLERNSSIEEQSRHRFACVQEWLLSYSQSDRIKDFYSNKEVIEASNKICNVNFLFK